MPVLSSVSARTPEGWRRTSVLAGGVGRDGEISVVISRGGSVDEGGEEGRPSCGQSRWGARARVSENGLAILGEWIVMEW